MNYRNRALLDLCYELECQAQIPGVCEGGTGEPMHANWSEFGKGGAMKAHDNFTASGCRRCHHEIDHGHTLTKDQRFNYWLRAYCRTQVQFWTLKLIGVSQPSVGERTVVEIVRTRTRRKSTKTGHANGYSTRSPDKCIKGKFA